MVPTYSVASNGLNFLSYSMEMFHKRNYSSEQINQYIFTAIDEIIYWIVWATLQVLAIFSYQISETTSIMFWWLTMIQQKSITFKSTQNQPSNRKFKRKYFDSSRMSAYNSKLLVMSTFMLYPYMTTFFSNPMHPEIMKYIAKCSEETAAILSPPWNCLMYWYNLKPPLGLIIESIVFSTEIISTILNFMQLCSY